MRRPVAEIKRESGRGRVDYLMQFLTPIRVCNSVLITMSMAGNENIDEVGIQLIRLNRPRALNPSCLRYF